MRFFHFYLPTLLLLSESEATFNTLVIRIWKGLGKVKYAKMSSIAEVIFLLFIFHVKLTLPLTRLEKMEELSLDENKCLPY